MTLPTYYNTGTASVANGATAVTGVGTAWVAFVSADDYFQANGLSVRILSVTDNTHLTLASPWPGTTLTSAAYQVAFTPDGSEMSGSVRSLLEALITGNIAALTVADGAEAAPSLRFLLEPGTGFWRNGAGKLATSILGVKASELTASGLAVGGGLALSGDLTAAAWTTAGIRAAFAAATYTDNSTAASATIAAAYMSAHKAATLAATNTAIVYTNVYGYYFEDPVAGLHVTITNKWALGADSAKITGALNVGGTLTAAALTVTGALTLSSLTVSGVVTATALADASSNAFDFVGTHSNIKTGGNYVLTSDSSGAAYFNSTSTTASAANAFLNNASSNQLLRSTSHSIYKTDIQPYSAGGMDAVVEAPLTSTRVTTSDVPAGPAAPFNLIDALRPVSYLSLCAADDPARRFVGFVSEEVAAVAPEYVHFTKMKALAAVTNSVGDIIRKADPRFDPNADPETPVPDGVMYDRLTVGLMAEMQSVRARLAAAGL